MFTSVGLLGIIGSLAILVAFVATALSALGYYQATTQPNTPEWRRLGRGAWLTAAGGLTLASGLLFYLLLTHQFQYAYVYQHSSLDQPLRYLISAFWGGQEGSFLLWVLYSSYVGIAVFAWTDRRYEAPVMAVLGVCQLFLTSMVLGLHLGPIQIGTEPFQMLAERFPDAPIFQQNAGFVPADGAGLNDLLLNPWMAIHPPTLFVGFATMVVPFAFAVAALWQRRYTDWVRHALPWTLLSVMVLGIGIVMGGYWAYITLSFGGYWAWDPVENSSLVPWIIGVAAIHTMLVQKRSGSSHKAALLLCILAFMFTVYSTFLTRSGILGDISVHSFVDLGMNNQLLVWILSMGLLGFGLFAYRYRELPAPTREPNILSREFMIFSGAMLLCALAAVIILGTSSPIIGRIFRDNPSTVPIEFYNKWTLPLSIGFVFLLGIGQLFWWHKMTVETLNRVLIKPMALAAVATVAVLVFTPFVEQTVMLPTQQAGQNLTQAGLLGGVGDFWAMYGTGLMLLVLLFFAFFALFGNGLVLWRVGRGNLRLAGGALTHVGFAITVLGLISSGAFSNPLARDGQVQVQGEETRDNFVLVQGETRLLNGYQVTYRGQRLDEDGHGVYTLDFVDPQGRAYTLEPVVYQSDTEQWIQNPDLKRFMEKDLYVAVTPSAMYEGGEDDPAAQGEVQLKPGEAVALGNNDYSVRLQRFERMADGPYVTDSTEVAVSATLEVTDLDTRETRTLTPLWVVQLDGTQRFIQNRVPDWGMTVAFTGIDVSTSTATLVFEGVQVMPDDWVVVLAHEKPFINLLWFGTILISIGFGVAFVRRLWDLRFEARRAATAA